MADKKHLEILSNGVDFWNKWREQNYNDALIRSGADKVFGSPYAVDPNFMHHFIDLKEIPDLSGANLKGFTLWGIVFRGCNIVGADLGGAILNGANLVNADLRGANLKGIWAYNANFSHAKLDGANIREALLQNSNFFAAILCGADLSDSWLKESDLRYANLSKATLTGACLYNCAREGWQIEDVSCNFIYFDAGRQTRQPQNRDFELGEFERVYRAIPTVEFVFENGINPYDPMLMDWITAKVHGKKPQLGLELLSIDRKGRDPKATFGIASENLREEAYNEIKLLYENTIQLLKQNNEQSQKLINDLLIHNRLLLQQIQQVKQITIYNGKYLEMHGNAKNIEIYITLAAQAIEEIKKVVEQESDQRFEGVSNKEKILNFINSILANLTTDGIKEMCRLANSELAPLLGAKLSPYLQTLNEIWNTIQKSTNF